ncbi:MAG TPA: phosphate ABC transporter substrate-binding protein PstS [Aggregatilineales bacterium]|nr:phosphate ABC transporter substrate-binding protein PstS [Aggregatilineales bacterium]
MKKLFSIGALVVVVALMVSTGSFNIQNTAAATAAATATPTLAPATPSVLATADVSLAVAGSGKVSGPLDNEAKTLNGGGATFPINLYANWAKTYRGVTGVAVNYLGKGSGAGRNDIIGNAVDFAGSDSPMTDAELAKAKPNGDILHIPTTIGGIVAVYNVPEMKGKDAIKLTGDTWAMIYDGKITKWNDPALVADNPDLKAVSHAILPVYRSESSGTTQNFTTYLSMMNKDFATTVKSGSTVNFPVGTGAQGNPGVAKQVDSTPYSIGYVELSFVGKLQAASLKNSTSGKFIVASAASMSKAALGVAIDPDLRTVIIGKSTDPDAYPLSIFTWILVYQQQKDAAKATALTRFLWWATHDGQVYNASLGYAPLPQQAIALDESQILKITVDGKQALPTSIATPGPAMAATMAK